MTATKKSAKRNQATTSKKQVNNPQPTAEQTAQRTTEQAQTPAQAKREWLRNISAEFQTQRTMLLNMGMEKEDIPTINEMLRKYYTEESHITELNTFDQWKEKGYQVKKGAKAFLFWGKPQPKQQDKAEDEQQEQTTETKSDFYPICYLFDISQCHSIKK